MTAPFSPRDFLRSRGAVLVHFSTVMSSHPDLLYPADMRNALSLKGVAHNAQPGKMAAQLRARVLWQWCSLRRAHSFEPFLDLALSRPQSANAEACKNGLHWFTIRVCSVTRFFRSRFGRLSSSSSIVGTAAMLQCRLSPRNHPRKPASGVPYRGDRSSRAGVRVTPQCSWDGMT